MTQAFGTKFIVTNDLEQPLNPKIFRNGPWIHHVTLRRGFKEYIAFRHANTNKVYVEEFDSQEGKFKEIKSDAEWEDIVGFLKEAGYLTISRDKEIRIATKFLTPSKK